MFKAPEQHKEHRYGGDLNNGVYKIPLSNRSEAFCIASNGAGWEHVSISIVSDKIPRTPTWSEMCRIKDLFWGEEDTVVQFHPPKSDYVNNHKHCLHLWRPTDQEIPRPDKILVGI